LRIIENRIVLAALFLLILSGFFIIYLHHDSDVAARNVVVYTSVDQVYSEPIFKEFENKTGIRILAVYDVEAAKTTGLVNRLIAEKNLPQADVFWSGEFAQTLLLKDKGILAPYSSLATRDIPLQYIDPQNYWTGFGGRARVILVNTNLLSPAEYPESILDLVDLNYSGSQIGIAYPSFGTAATQAAALYAALGPEKARNYYNQLKSKGVRVVDGNSVVRDLVASGRLKVGLTDTDDACGSLRNKAPVAMIFPDQNYGSLGTLIIPNTVAMIAGAPHPAEAQALIDYLLSKDTEEKLVASNWIQIPVRDIGSSNCIKNSKIKRMNVSFSDVFRNLETAENDMTEIFIR
jgi:iron(III) transport system substrate-binding protein